MPPTANQKDNLPSAAATNPPAVASGFGQNRLPFAGAGGGFQKPAGAFSSGFAGFGQKPAASTGKAFIGFGFNKPEPVSKAAEAQATEASEKTDAQGVIGVAGQTVSTHGAGNSNLFGGE